MVSRKTQNNSLYNQDKNERMNHLAWNGNGTISDSGVGASNGDADQKHQLGTSLQVDDHDNVRFGLFGSERGFPGIKNFAELIEYDLLDNSALVVAGSGRTWCKKTLIRQNQIGDRRKNLTVSEDGSRVVRWISRAEQRDHRRIIPLSTVILHVSGLAHYSVISYQEFAQYLGISY
ncbi:unnamed protein product [Sphenostylis stenocarpa]|uniref:Uncharacterized protein n=1 Tax=Sphenostylis stenocarpa TaxID=92480 RepID=A0AA86VKW2_9FABA|nr:unnamed protein product [Sphenostylis stenocarpa]